MKKCNLLPKKENFKYSPPVLILIKQSIIKILLGLYCAFTFSIQSHAKTAGKFLCPQFQQCFNTTNLIHEVIC